MADATHSGYKRIILHSYDSDVIIIAISCVQDLCLEELWIAFGSGKIFRYIPAHSIARTMGPEKSRALLAFHALTGCDIVSSFYGKGKNSMGSLTRISGVKKCIPESIEEEEVMSYVEAFVVRLYDSLIESTSFNAARLELYCHKARDFNYLPPTKDALLQHTLRAAYQAGHVWGESSHHMPSSV